MRACLGRSSLRLWMETGPFDLELKDMAFMYRVEGRAHDVEVGYCCFAWWMHSPSRSCLLIWGGPWIIFLLFCLSSCFNAVYILSMQSSSHRSFSFCCQFFSLYCQRWLCRLSIFILQNRCYALTYESSRLVWYLRCALPALRLWNLMRGSRSYGLCDMYNLAKVESQLPSLAALHNVSCIRHCFRIARPFASCTLAALA